MRGVLLFCLLMAAVGAQANGSRQPMFDVGNGASGSGASLFVDRADGGLFAPAFRPTPVPVSFTDDVSEASAEMMSEDPVRRLRDFIASAEAGRAGYDAVQHGAKKRPDKRPTAMTVAEIDAWVRATPGQSHAIGRYQFIPKTLRRLVVALEVPPNAVFSPALQDRLADRLLEEAGLLDFATGSLPRTEFMQNLAEIWAGLPTATGLSHYHGKWGNRATKTWAEFESAMAGIFG